MHHHELQPRSGLAPLEMVLALPILLFIMALMINFGTVACWKVRALSVARQAVWGTRWPRTANTDPLPVYWPNSAGFSAGGAGNVPPLDDPRVKQPVARGPLPMGGTVNSSLLDPTRGLREGSAGITRNYPTLAKMGPFHLDAKTRLLDDQWQYERMGMWSNRQRRIPVIYALAKAPPSLVAAYVQTVVTLLNAPFRPDLRPLDRDDEFIYYGKLFGWGSGAPDFHPLLVQFCAVDHDVAHERVQDLVDRIQGKTEKDENGNITKHIPGVPERMTQAFINLYQKVISALKAQLGTVPPPPPGQMAAIQAQINQLQAAINTLSQFLATLKK